MFISSPPSIAGLVVVTHGNNKLGSDVELVSAIGHMTQLALEAKSPPSWTRRLTAVTLPPGVVPRCKISYAWLYSGLCLYSSTGQYYSTLAP